MWLGSLQRGQAVVEGGGVAEFERHVREQGGSDLVASENSLLVGLAGERRRFSRGKNGHKR